MRTFLLLLSTLILVVHHASALEAVFSGPQPNEKLPAFKVRGILDDLAGKDLDFVEQANGQPLVLIFIHDVNRQSIGFVRNLTRYTMSRSKEGLTTGIVMLADDTTTAEATVKRMQHALVRQAPIAVSPEGREGPGSYGLNRTMTLTILVAKENRVAANFALVQPSIQVDLPKVVEAICQVVGGPAPSLQELLADEPGMREMIAKESTSGSSENLDVRSLLRPLIQLDATKEQVEESAKKIVAAMEKSPELRKEIYRIATTIVESGKLPNYGTEWAREQLTQWAAEAKAAKANEEGQIPISDSGKNGEGR